LASEHGINTQTQSCHVLVHPVHFEYIGHFGWFFYSVFNNGSYATSLELGKTHIISTWI
jgi:hypothetical protein